jgi:hypothetical protein
MSIRQDILDATVDALKKITKRNGYNTNVSYVSTYLNIKHPEEINHRDLPALFPYDDNEEKEALSIFNSTKPDMMSTLSIIVTAVVYDRRGDTATMRTDLMEDVEKVLVNDEDLMELLIENPTPVGIATDKGAFDNYSVWDQTFEMKYIYNHGLE